MKYLHHVLTPSGKVTTMRIDTDSRPELADVIKTLPAGWSLFRTASMTTEEFTQWLRGDE